MEIRYRHALAVMLALAFLAVGTTAGAQNDCIAGKGKCAFKKSTGMGKCRSKAEKEGADTGLAECLAKANAKFDGDLLVPPEPGKGCFARLEAKDLDGPGPVVGVDDCATFFDKDVLEATIDAFVDDLLDELIASYPGAPVSANTCRAGKIKCAYQKAQSIIKCHVKRAKDPTFIGADYSKCLDKARAKFGGKCDSGPGLDHPCTQDSDCGGGALCAKGCFTKLEAKQDPLLPETLCDTTDDAPAIEAKIDLFVYEVLCPLGYGGPPVSILGCVDFPTLPTPTPTP